MKEKNNYCTNCFKDKGVFDVCPHCGWTEENDRREAYHLPALSVINERYIIGRVLGFGGFGVTYKAWDTALNIAVAIKEYYPAGLVNRIPNEKEIIAFSGDKREVFETGLLRFLEEARNMAKFSDHPYIVNVFDFFEENNTAYIIMEFLDGETLKKYVEQCGGKISYEDTLNIMEPIMRALEELHKANIIHRDVSPDNIYITFDNKIKLIASTSSLNKKRLSMLFLSYLASASSEGGMPLNKSSFDEYVESNSQFFGFLNEYTNEELGVKYIDCAVTGVEPSEVQNEQ